MPTKPETRRAWYARTRDARHAYAKGQYAKHRDVWLERKRAERAGPNGDAMRARDRAWDARNATRDHGIDHAELGRLYAAQNGRCAICDTPAPMRGKGCLHVDHDHATGVRRGLLCFNCNRALDVIERAGATWALRALTYLGDPPLPRLRATAKSDKE